MDVLENKSPMTGVTLADGGDAFPVELTQEQRIDRDPSLILDIDFLFELVGAGSIKQRLGRI